LAAAGESEPRFPTSNVSFEETDMPKMKAATVAKAGADFEIVERDIPSPGAGQVRIRVQACGICFSD
jgi:hypothetical protein